MANKDAHLRFGASRTLSRRYNSFIIPFVDNRTQRTIPELLMRAHEARKEARALLESAKRAVEIAIERTETKALVYLNDAMS